MHPISAFRWKGPRRSPEEADGGRLHPARTPDMVLQGMGGGALTAVLLWLQTNLWVESLFLLAIYRHINL
jgi:hypothetical protein